MRYQYLPICLTALFAVVAATIGLYLLLNGYEEPGNGALISAFFGAAVTVGLAYDLAEKEREAVREADAEAAAEDKAERGSDDSE